MLNTDCTTQLYLQLQASTFLAEPRGMPRPLSVDMLSSRRPLYLKDLSKGENRHSSLRRTLRKAEVRDEETEGEEVTISNCDTRWSDRWGEMGCHRKAPPSSRGWSSSNDSTGS